MGDRILINTSASSIFFYSLSSGGGVALITILILGLRTLHLLIFFIFKLKCYRKTNFEIINFSSLILITLFLRGVLETSFGIFSIDYVMYILAILFMEHKYSLLKKKLN